MRFNLSHSSAVGFLFSPLRNLSASRLKPRDKSRHVFQIQIYIDIAVKVDALAYIHASDFIFVSTRSCSSEAKSNGDDGGDDSFHADSIGRKARGRKYAAEGAPIMVQRSKRVTISLIKRPTNVPE